MTDITNPIFQNVDAARAHLESIRWPNGPVCPHCGNVDQNAISKVEGKKHSHRPGLFYCNACKGQFTVTVGTVMERSKVPLNKWVYAFHLYAASKKGMSAHQLHRMIGVTYKTAWFMAHRIREAMRDDTPVSFGSGGGMVEVDETFIGNNKAKRKARPGKGHRKPHPGLSHKYKVLALVDRNTGMARSIVVDDLKMSTLGPILRENMAKEAALMTDELPVYKGIGKGFSAHHSVSHRMGEYVNRKNPEIHTNTIEGYFSIFKRGMKGVYQHCGRQHLHRYTAEFEFRYNTRTANEFTDAMRADMIVKGAEGKRLTYRRTDAWARA